MLRVFPKKQSRRHSRGSLGAELPPPGTTGWREEEVGKGGGRRKGRGRGGEGEGGGEEEGGGGGGGGAPWSRARSGAVSCDAESSRFNCC